VLRALEERLKGSSPKDERELRDVIGGAIQEVDHPGAALILEVAIFHGGNTGSNPVGDANRSFGAREAP
jgi:hypothetical protein